MVPLAGHEGKNVFLQLPIDMIYEAAFIDRQFTSQLPYLSVDIAY